MRRIAIMQGRLLAPESDSIQCFPRERWREEFRLAAAAGLDGIEWIYDAHGADVNPLNTDSGVGELRALCAEFHISVGSLCADYFLDRPLVRTSDDALAELVSHLEWLIERCAIADIQRIVLPFVDASRLETTEDQERVVAVLTKVLPLARASAVELHLETSLPPEAFSVLLNSVPDPLVRVNYDSGNSASLGYDVSTELAAYGQRIGSIHVKDRLRGGTTVPLGAGHADLQALFTGLVRLRYGGDYVLQVARGEAGREVEWARQNCAFVNRQIAGALTKVR